MSAQSRGRPGGGWLLVWVLILAMGGGVAAGLGVSWWLWPVEYTDVSPDTLNPTHRAEYIKLISHAYAHDKDLRRAQVRLAALGDLGSVGVEVVTLADRAKVKTLYLFHHDPDQNDDAISAKLDDAQARLQALCDTDDGFVLAERDLEIRGPGHLFGYRQSGAGGLQFANLAKDPTLLERAEGLVRRILEADPKLESVEHAAARAAIERWERRAAVREDAG